MSTSTQFVDEPFRALIGLGGPGQSSLIRIVPVPDNRRTQQKVRSELISQLDESLEGLEMLKVGRKGVKKKKKNKKKRKRNPRKKEGREKKRG